MVNKKKNEAQLLKICMFIFLTLWCISFFVCLAWLFVSSLKGRIEFLTSPLALPTEWLFSNYIDAFTQLQASGNSLLVMIINTLWLTAGNIFLQTISSLTFAYVIARFKFPGRNLIYWVVIVRMMITLVGTLPATYQLYLQLGIYDNPLFLITNLHGTANFLVYYATFKGVSNTYAEAAYMDGANHIKIFFRIMLPQVTGIIIATTVSSFIANWNEYLTPLLFLPSWPTIASGIYTYQIEFARQLNYPVLFAALIMTIIPCVVLFVIFQESFLSINIGGGLKE